MSLLLTVVVCGEPTVAAAIECGKPGNPSMRGPVFWCADLDGRRVAAVVPVSGR
jgi:hypothetical protein